MAVTNAIEALSLLGRRKDEEELSYDLILADVHMPDMDGFELLHHVNDNFNIPVIRKFLFNMIFTRISSEYIQTSSNENSNNFYVRYNKLYVLCELFSFIHS